MFLLCDVNAMYASCEQLFRPDLKGKPVIVLINNDGAIVAANREAKALCIKRGAPLFQANGIDSTASDSLFQFELRVIWRHQPQDNVDIRVTGTVAGNL
jgi:nucleotidyltransferase/DNA polymerase involved in DNA repair